MRIVVSAAVLSTENKGDYSPLLNAFGGLFCLNMLWCAGHCAGGDLPLLAFSV
jgi:hypothetical protein